MKYLLLLASTLATANAAPVPYDIVVYGGTSGGVVAAAQAKKSGKTVVLISPTTHLGGLTSNGLGLTDLGDVSILGGLSREFYHRLYLHYQNDSAWNWQTKNLSMGGQGGPGFDSTNQIASIFEPKVAEAIFNQFIAEENVPVITGRLDLDAGVVMNAGKISFLRLEDGREFSGKMFIDASYEGDLLPGAGVSFTVGRESNATYNETLSGIQTGRTGNQLRDNINPYVIPGNPASGLLPGVNADAGGANGTGDTKLQAYCFRMCLTNVAANRVMITQPPGYNEADYEILFRSIDAGQTNNFFKLSAMPNKKTDSNNNGGISCDFIGKNYGPGWDWTTLNHDERLALAKKHENWQRGLVWTLQNHPRVPETIRSSLASWGLPKDEFTDNGNWSRQLYVREARRMISDYVMTEANCRRNVIAPDSIGIGAYAMDSHHVQRHVRNGMVKNEGDVQFQLGGAYKISYRSIVPKQGQCQNLLVPWALSATHMAFGSIRMEPVFMTLSQSAAIAANMAIDQNISVQNVSYLSLRPALLAVGQSLGDPIVEPPTSPTDPATVVDNTNASLVTITGSWTSSTSVAGYYGTNFINDGNSGQGTKQVFFRIPPSLTGLQRVYLRWTENANRASNAPIEIIHRGGIATLTVNQRANGAKWNLLGIHTFTGAATEGLVIKTTGADGFVIADAVGFTPVGPDEDSDGDGITDVKESVLGLDPEVSNAAFIAAVKSNPGFFDLHSENEIHDMWITQPSLSGSGTPSFDLDFSMLNSDRNVFEDFSLTVPGDSVNRFFRVAVQP